MSKPANINDGGFPLPEVINPPRVCVQLWIPDEDAHLRAFWGAMWELTRWFNWEFDEDKTAKKVADVWRDVWLTNHEGWRERGCMREECCGDLLSAQSETNDLLAKILKLMQGGMTANIQFAAASGLSDIIIDCTPPKFNAGSDDDDVPEQIKRANALCLTVEKFVAAFIVYMAKRLNMPQTFVNQAAAIPTISGTDGFLTAKWSWRPDVYVSDVKAWLNTPYYPDAICLIINELGNKETTLANFGNALDSVDRSELPSEYVKLLDGLNASMKEPQTFEAFAKQLNESYDLIADSAEEYTCPCYSGTCDPADIEIVSMNDCIITRLTDTTWRVEQPNYTIPDPLHPENRLYQVKFRDVGYRCFNASGYTESMSSYGMYNCSGVYSEGVGGGGGNGIQFTFNHGQNTDYHAIDAVLTVMCP